MRRCGVGTRVHGQCWVLRPIPHDSLLPSAIMLESDHHPRSGFSQWCE
jgi:hypothetical protein